MGKQQQPRGGRVVPLRWTNQTGDAAADTAAADGNCAAPVAAPGQHEKKGPTIISSVLDVVACLLPRVLLLTGSKLRAVYSTRLSLAIKIFKACLLRYS